MPFYSALRGALFTIALVVLIFFLKVICPIDTGCLADPFLLILFSPLALFEIFHISTIVDSSTEPFGILLFWALIGFIVGFLVHAFFPAQKIKEITDEEGI